MLADTVVLKDGRVLQGKVTAQNQQILQINVNGQLMIFQKSQIIRVNYDKGVPPVDPAETARKAEEDRRAEIARQQQIEQQRKIQEARLKLEEETKRKQEDDRRLKDLEEKRKKELQSAEERKEQEHRELQQKQLDSHRPIQIPRSVLYSAILPGYGQMSSGHGIRGTAYMTLFFSSIAVFVYSRNAANHARAAYSQAVNNYWISRAFLSPQEALLLYNDSDKRAYQTHIDQANSAAIATLTVYGLQLADAHSLTRNKNEDVSFAYSWNF